MTAQRLPTDVYSTETLAIDNNPAGIAAASSWFEGLRLLSAASDTVWHAMSLCLEEALTNVVSYADSDGSGIEIDVIFSKEQDSFRIDIIDSGFAFDPLQVEPVRTESLDTMTPGGQGINLIRSFSTSCTYSRRNTKNHLSLIFDAG